MRALPPDRPRGQLQPRRLRLSRRVDPGLAGPGRPGRASSRAAGWSRYGLAGPQRRHRRPAPRHPALTRPAVTCHVPGRAGGLGWPRDFVKIFTSAPSRTTRTQGSRRVTAPAATERDADVIVVGAGPAGSDRGVPPGAVRARRPAAGEDGLPAREGLRRRPDPPRGQAAGRAGHRHQPGGRAGCTTRACASSAAGTASSCRGPTSRRSPTTAWCARAPTSTSILARQARQGRRPSCTSAPTSTGPGPRPRTGRILGRHGAARRGRRHRGSPRPPTARRSSSPPTATRPGCRWRWACASATTARWASPSAPTTRARATTTTGSSPGSSSGTAPARTDKLLPGYGWIFGVGDGTVNVGLGILNTSTAFGNVDYRELLKTLARPDARGVGLPRREHDPAHPRRRAPDGLQPHAALHPRPAARR